MNKTVGRPFEKGRSGNPGGRPKDDPDLKVLAREQTKAAIDRLVHWLNSNNATASVRAAQALLERGWGRPVQPVAGPEGEGAVTVVIKKIVRESPCS